jgi:hypothetical protein
MSNTRTVRARATSPARARQSKPEPPKIKVLGKEYRIADKVGIWPLMQFSRAAESGATLRDMRGLAAAHAMMEDALHPDDWPEFQDDMIAKKLDDLGPLMDAVNQTVELLSARKSKNGRAKTIPGTADAVEITA